MTSIEATPETSLCVGCGLCCDGTLFARARSEQPDEQWRLSALGFDFEDFNDAKWFKQPCPMASCGTCTIYADRPAVCRSFRCSLLKSFEAGEIDRATATEKITTAKALLAAVVADDPDAGSYRYRKEAKLAQAFESADQPTRRNIGPKLVRLAALETFLSRWFTKKDEKREGEGADFS